MTYLSAASRYGGVEGSLRDRFAMAALTVMDSGGFILPEIAAKLAYQMADAMLEARGKK